MSFPVPKYVLDMLELFRSRWPKHPVTETTISAYAICLGDVPPEALRTATVQLLRTAQWFPGIDEIRDLARGPRGALSAEEAWEEVIGQVRKEGYYGKPKFSSPTVARAVEALGGWNNVASQLTEQVGTNRAHFLRIYSAIAKSSARELEYAGAKQITDGLAGLLGGGTKQLYGEDYTDPIEEDDLDGTDTDVLPD